MSIEITATKFRENVSELTNRVEYSGETVYVTKHHRRAVALVPSATAELLEQIEDLLDEKAVSCALAQLAEGKIERKPFVRRTKRGAA